MFDSLNTGGKIRIFNVIDDYNRECLSIEVDHLLSSKRVIQSLEIEQMWVYNKRPHSSISGIPPRKRLEDI
jgi:transposase InsO family protein